MIEWLVVSEDLQMVISLYICELIIHKDYRRMSLGNELLKFVHSLYPKTRMELLANSSSRSFYEEQGFRTFTGLKKNIRRI